MRTILLFIISFLSMASLLGQQNCPKAYEYANKMKADMTSPCFTGWEQYARWYQNKCLCDEGLKSEADRSKVLNNLAGLRRVINANYTNCGDGAVPEIKSCPLKGENGQSPNEKGEPTQEEREQKFYEGLQAGAQKYQEAKARKDNLQNDFDASKEIQDDHIKDRSIEAARKAQYDGSDDLEAMMNQEALNRLDASSGEFDEEPLEEVKKAELEELLEESSVAKKKKYEENKAYYDQREALKKSYDEWIKEMGTPRYEPCEETDWTENFYRSSNHMPDVLEDIEEKGKNKLRKSLEDFANNLQESILSMYRGTNSIAGKLVRTLDRVQEQFGEAIDNVAEAKDDLENIWSDWDEAYEEAMQFEDGSAEKFEEWMDKSYDESIKIVKRRLLGENYLRAEEVVADIEEKVHDFNHNRIMETDCDEQEYRTNAYSDNIGKIVDEIFNY